MALTNRQRHNSFSGIAAEIPCGCERSDKPQSVLIAVTREGTSCADERSVLGNVLYSFIQADSVSTVSTSTARQWLHVRHHVKVATPQVQSDSPGFLACLRVLHPARPPALMRIMPRFIFYYAANPDSPEKTGLPRF